MSTPGLPGLAGAGPGEWPLVDSHGVTNHDSDYRAATPFQGKAIIMRRFPILLALAFMLVLSTGGARAGGEGLMNAIAFRPLPPDKVINIRSLDDSEDNLVLVAQFERELRARGYRVSKDAALILTFEVRSEVGAWSAGDRRSIIELEGHGGVDEDEVVKARLNIFDSGRGGLLNAGPGGGTTITTASQYRLDATIDDRRDGHRLWQAWAVADLRQSDGPTLTKAMVPVMVRNLGSTVKRQPFKLP